MSPLGRRIRCLNGPDYEVHTLVRHMQRHHLDQKVLSSGIQLLASFAADGRGLGALCLQLEVVRELVEGSFQAGSAEREQLRSLEAAVAALPPALQEGPPALTTAPQEEAATEKVWDSAVRGVEMDIRQIVSGVLQQRHDPAVVSAGLRSLGAIAATGKGLGAIRNCVAHVEPPVYELFPPGSEEREMLTALKVAAWQLGKVRGCGKDVPAADVGSEKQTGSTGSIRSETEVQTSCASTPASPKAAALSEIGEEARVAASPASAEAHPRRVARIPAPPGCFEAVLSASLRSWILPKPVADAPSRYPSAPYAHSAY